MKLPAMLQDMIALTPFSQYNHYVCPNRIKVVGDYRHAQGQFLLSQPINSDTTFNLSITGMGVLKANTFGSFDEAVNWAASNYPMHFQCLRFRGPAGKSFSFGVRVRGQNVEFWPFKPGKVNSQKDCNILPMRKPQTVLAFDIECGDIQVAVTNMSSGGRQVVRVFHGYCSQQIQMNRVALGSQVSLKSPIPHSLCKTDHDILTPGTVLLLNVDGPVQEHHSGSYFRIWIIKKKSWELYQRGPVSDWDQSYNSSKSEMIAMEPKKKRTFMIVVKSNELHIKDPCSHKSRDIIKERFDQQGLPLWLEFYRVGFTIQKTALSWDWQDDNLLEAFDTPPPPPRNSNVPLTQPTLSPLQTASEQVININTNSWSRNPRHRKDSNISVNLHCSPPTDTFSPFLSPYNDNNSVDNNNIRQSPIPFTPSIKPTNTKNDTNNKNNNFRAMEDFRDLDPMASASCTALKSVWLGSNPCLAPTMLKQSCRYPVGGEKIPSKENPTACGEFDAVGYNKHLRQSQISQDGESYLSVLSGLGESNNSQQTTFPSSVSSNFGTRPIPQSAPVPCPGTKHKREKNNNSLQSSNLLKTIPKKVTERLRKNSSKTEEKRPAEASGVASRESSQFFNEGFFDGDLYSRDELSKKSLSSVSIITTTNSIPRSQATAFSPENHQLLYSSNRKPENGSCSSSRGYEVGNQLNTFKPEMDNIARGNMLQPQSPSSCDTRQDGDSSETDDVSSLRLNPNHANNNVNNSNNGGNSNLRMRLPLRASAHSIANDSGVGVENEGDKSDVIADLDDDDTDDALSDTSTTGRQSLSSFNSSGSHHNTAVKTVS